MEYNCVGGKMNRGLSVLATYSRLIAPRQPTEQEIKEADMLGWCIEWLQAFFLVSDDIMDGAWTVPPAPLCAGRVLAPPPSFRRRFAAVSPLPSPPPPPPPALRAAF